MKRKDEQKVERELEERATEEKRQWSGSTPTEDVMERALETGGEADPGDGDAERREEDDPSAVPHSGANPT